MQGRSWAWTGALALIAGGCTPGEEVASAGSAPPAAAPVHARLGAASAALLTGRGIAQMAAVYARPRDPAQVRQLSGTNPRPSEPAPRAPEAVRPEAQVNPVQPPAPPPQAPPPPPPVAAATPKVDLAQGRALFTDNSCGACHALADARATGGVGPSLDGNAALSRALIVDRVSNGSGPMPGFAGQLSAAEIGTLADYILAAKK